MVTWIINSLVGSYRKPKNSFHDCNSWLPRYYTHVESSTFHLSLEKAQPSQDHKDGMSLWYVWKLSRNLGVDPAIQETGEPAAVIKQEIVGDILSIGGYFLEKAVSDKRSDLTLKTPTGKGTWHSVLRIAANADRLCDQDEYKLGPKTVISEGKIAASSSKALLHHQLQ